MNARYTISSLFSLPAAVATIASFGILVASTAQAVPISYGNHPAATVTYTNVEEDTNSFGDVPPKFGPPNIVGDTMDFDPIGFNANASGAAGVDVTDAQLKFGIVAHPGKLINTIAFAEAGDTTLAGFGTNATVTNVSGFVFVDILDVDGVPLGLPVSVPGIAMSFAPSGGSYELGTDGGGGPIFTTAWNGGVTINVNSLLTANAIPFVGGATRLQVTLDNTLLATSELGTTSFIAKKDADGITITVNVPEPATGALAACGLALAGIVRRRR